MKKINIKLLGAACMLLLAMAMVGVGTFAWFTVSTEATAGDIMVRFDAYKWPFEASFDYDPDDPDAATWAKELNVSELLKNMNADDDPETEQTDQEMSAAPLRPVSTADLQHWYTAVYDGSGSVLSFSLEDLNGIANQPWDLKYDTGLGKTVDMGNNHLIYFDLWVRAMNEDKTYALKLQTAAANADGSYGDQMVEESDYGTYVLEAPIWDDTENKYVTRDEPLSGLNSARIGFAALNPDGTFEDEENGWFIYEPNADSHASDVGYGATESDGKAIYRLYEEDTEDGDRGTRVSGYEDETDPATYVPTPDGSGYKMVEQPTVQQYHSEWDATALEKLGKDDQVDSTCIGTLGLGQFIDQPPVLTNITYGTPKKIRVFIWIEGQDVDCWNQIMGGSIFANFEFTGVEVENPEPAEPGDAAGDS